MKAFRNFLMRWNCNKCFLLVLLVLLNIYFLQQLLTINFTLILFVSRKKNIHTKKYCISETGFQNLYTWEKFHHTWSLNISLQNKDNRTSTKKIIVSSCSLIIEINIFFSYKNANDLKGLCSKNSHRFYVLNVLWHALVSQNICNDLTFI